MPYNKLRPVVRPCCKKCGRYLVGGIGGYCPATHHFATTEDFIKAQKTMLATYPADSEYEMTRMIRQKIVDSIRRAEHGTSD